MNRHFLLTLLLFVIGFGAYSQSVEKPTFHVFNFNDGAILRNISDNGKWGVAYGTNDANSLWMAFPKLINFDDDKVTELLTEEESNGLINSASANDVTDDGSIVAGSYDFRPAIYHTATGEWEKLPTPEAPNGSVWDNGVVNAITPDGKYAVGTMSYNSYYGEIPVLWSLEGTPTMIETNWPDEDLSGTSQNQTRFTDISTDGKRIVGCVSYSYINTVMYFLYHVDSKTWEPIGYNIVDNKYVPRHEYIHHCNSVTLSKDGKLVSGTMYMIEPIEGSQYFNEYVAPFVYDVDNDSFTIYNDINDHGMVITAIENDGTIFASTPDGSPVREWHCRVDGYWYSFDQILRQIYDIDFNGATGYDNTGTMWAMSNDGLRFVSFPYPIGESYMVELPATFPELAKQVDLLSSYNITPAVDKSFSKLQTMQIAFDRDVEVIGEAESIIIFDENGNEVKAANKIALKTGETKIVDISFGRAVTLEDGVKYNVVIPEGTIQILGDPERKNKTITASYTGRAQTPVTMVSASPADGASVAQINLTANPIVVTFDTDVILCENPENLPKAHLYQIYEDATEELLVDMYVLAANNQILIYPINDQYLFENSNYKVRIDAGTVSDIIGDNPNEAFELNYKGSYVREINSDDNVIYQENFDNWNSAFSQTILYEGDHNNPTDEMKSFEFDADNTPWNFSLRDNENYDYAAASHSLYNPAGKSDDWLSTPQLYIPDNKCILTFDAQSLQNTGDHIKVIIWENSEVINILNDRTIEDYRNEGKVIFDTQLYSGGSENLTGEWQHFTYELADYAEKDIYIAFVNENENKGMIFIDNVVVKRQAEFIISLESESVVVRQDKATIKGRIKVENETETYSEISLTLKDAAGNEVETIQDNGLSLKMGDIYSFTFNNQISLEYGRTNKYTVEVKLGEHKNTARGAIKNLYFKPTKRVVVEKFTGNTCVNCPKGIIAFDLLEEAYGDLFIPIAIHTYTGDPFNSGLSEYSSFLGLIGAPSGVVNRSGEVTYPLAQDAQGAWIYSDPQNPLWWDAVAKEFETFAEADIKIVDAQYNTTNKTISIPVNTTFAVDAEGQNINLFGVILENGLDGVSQINGLAGFSDPLLGEWGKDGEYGKAAVPYTYDHVARGVYGTTWNGTGGIIPANVTSGVVYENTLTLNIPESIRNIQNCDAVVMMIDANTGKVINAAMSKIYDVTSVEGIDTDANISVESRNGMVIVNMQGEGYAELYATDSRMISATEGHSQITLNTNGYTGVAIVKINSDNNSYIRKMIIK